MRPLMKVAMAPADSLTASASLEMVSFCISSSSTLTLLAFSAADWAEGIMAAFDLSIGDDDDGRKIETGESL